MSLVATVAAFVDLAQGTKVSRLVTGRASCVDRLNCSTAHDLVRFGTDGGLRIRGAIVSDEDDMEDVRTAWSVNPTFASE
jgi:hypothetical protein